MDQQMKKIILDKNYINLKTDKKFLQSSNKEYVKSFINHKNFKKTDILEIHNRPNYIKQIKKFYNKKIFLYFHNDPLTMNGSSSLIRKTIFIRKS